MTLFVDARVPVRFGPVSDAGPETALLVEGDRPVPFGVAFVRCTLARVTSHAAGCACCTPRGPAAEALGRLFLARARDANGWFRSVLAVVDGPDGRAAVLAALADDPLTSARFRLA
ncbi:MAG: hypothetical protein M3Y41_08400 [Pseudomonadota bacterium]|nr:hypothetical protein [Pseudomonadota bacterium]